MVGFLWLPKGRMITPIAPCWTCHWSLITILTADKDKTVLCKILFKSMLKITDKDTFQKYS